MGEELKELKKKRMLTKREKKLTRNRPMSMGNRKVVEYSLSQSGRKGRSMEGRIYARVMS